MFRKALIVGATGFIATELTKQLLEKGYFVVGTVRDLKSQQSQFLQKLAEPFPGTLKLVEGNVMTPGVFDEAVKDVHYVFHTASPVILFPRKELDPYRDLIDVAVQGTENVLNSIAEHGKHVRRVVLTSGLSAAAPPFTPDPNHTVTTEDWNEVSSVENGQAYSVSKVLQEKKAMQIAKEKGIDLVSVLPSMTAGPVLSPGEDSESYKIFKMSLKLKTLNCSFPIDVRDVAKAHVLAAELPEAHGRYFVTCTRPDDIVLPIQAAKRLFPNLLEVEDIQTKFFVPLDTSRTENELLFRPRDSVCYYADAIRTWHRLGL